MRPKTDHEHPIIATNPNTINADQITTGAQRPIIAHDLSTMLNGRS